MSFSFDIVAYFVANRYNSQNQLWARGYPHRQVQIRGRSQNQVQLIDLETGESFEKMEMSVAHREVFPGAIYFAQDGDGELIVYRSENLDIDRRKAWLRPVANGENSETKAMTNLAVSEIDKLAEPKIVSTNIPGGAFRLTLVWGEITFSVTGYQLLSIAYRQGKEVRTILGTNDFDLPYKTQYQAPVVKVETSLQLVDALGDYMHGIKRKIAEDNDGKIPGKFTHLWRSPSAFFGLHSMGHQIIFAVPLVVLSSSKDVEWFVEKQGENMVGYFFDTCDGGNGASEAIFKQLSKFAEKGAALARNCDCEFGCPRCLTQHSCPQGNKALDKDAGLFLLDAIAFGDGHRE